LYPGYLTLPIQQVLGGVVVGVNLVAYALAFRVWRRQTRLRQAQSTRRSSSYPPGRRGSSRRFQVRGDVGVRHGLADVGFEVFRAVVPPLDRPGARHHDMQGNEGTGAGLARAQGVKFQPLPAVAVEYGFDGPDFFLGEGNVHQACGGAPQQLPPGPHDIQGHQQGNHRIEPEPAGRPYQPDSCNDPRGRPDIGEQVVGVASRVMDRYLRPTPMRMRDVTRLITDAATDTARPIPTASSGAGSAGALDGGICDADGQQ